ncbi:hypothetical protein A7K94_0215510 [Modestobacter sp. VKM Ac-2676]|nr:hypothetical protein A7K94_0215510 [Modestobacter sp. VKM Ac-2676]
MYVRRGRIDRRTWWLQYALPLAVLSVLALLADVSLGNSDLQRIAAGETGYGPLVVATGLLTLPASISGGIARLHDRGMAAGWILVGLLPWVGPAALLVLTGLLRGDRGPNRYGPAPGRRPPRSHRPSHPSTCATAPPAAVRADRAAALPAAVRAALLGLIRSGPGSPADRLTSRSSCGAVPRAAARCCACRWRSRARRRGGRARCRRAAGRWCRCRTSHWCPRGALPVAAPGRRSPAGPRCRPRSGPARTAWPCHPSARCSRGRPPRAGGVSRIPRTAIPAAASCSQAATKPAGRYSSSGPGPVRVPA